MSAVKTKKVISLNSIFRYFLLIIAIIFFAIILRKNEMDKKVVIKDEPVIAVTPEVILPGYPVMITVNASSSPSHINFDGKKVSVINYNSKPRSFVAIPLESKQDKYRVEIKLNSGAVYTKEILISKRDKVEKPLGIPDSMGGNTKSAGKSLVDKLAQENKIITNIKTSSTTLWSKKFVSPLKTLVITDEYGYGRNTVGYSITHKGTDFRAATGTAVMAINSGIVRVARLFDTYGNTIIIDHGNGLSSLYMHLSKIKVKEGQNVIAGQVIGLSGQTGYVSAAHLHLSIKVNGISIDPVIFLRFFGVI